MATFRSRVLAGAAALALTACAQSPTSPGADDHAGHHPAGAAAPASAPADRMAMMDAHMAKMREMHEKMTRAAGTPQERQALMAEHMKLMEDGMAMMQSMMQMMMDRMQAPAPASK